MPAPFPSTIPPGGGLLLPVGTTTRGTASCAHDHPTSGRALRKGAPRRPKASAEYTRPRRIRQDRETLGTAGT